MTEPLVYLVGAGPGHPGLLTLRAVEVLHRADVVLYDRLVAPTLLEYAPPNAQRISVTELGPHHAERCGGELPLRAARGDGGAAALL